MKGMFDSEETLIAYATIDAGIYFLGAASRLIANSTPSNPIDFMIDNVTGYGKAKLQEHKESIIACLEDMIEAKKVIEADYTNEETLLNKVKNE